MANYLDAFMVLRFAGDIGAAVESVGDFNERLDAAKIGEEVALDIPDNHEPRYPGHMHGGHKAKVSKIYFRKES